MKAYAVLILCIAFVIVCIFLGCLYSIVCLEAEQANIKRHLIIVERYLDPAEQIEVIKPNGLPLCFSRGYFGDLKTKLDSLREERNEWADDHAEVERRFWEHRLNYERYK